MLRKVRLRIDLACIGLGVPTIGHVEHLGRHVTRTSRLRQRMMQPISFGRRQVPPEVIRHAVWAYYRFTLSYRDVGELPADRGIDV